MTNILRKLSSRLLHSAPLQSTFGMLWKGLGVGLVLVACSSSPQLPGDFAQVDSIPDIYPDYVGVTVPSNIAPLTFMLDNYQAEDMVARFSVGGKEWIVGSAEGVCPSMEEWAEMKEAALKDKENKLDVEVYAQVGKDGKWKKYKKFSIYVSPDKIDPYISYRLISPSYVTYEGLTINQRCLETYEENVIYSNMQNTTEKDGQCINCHSYQNYDPNRMQFHCRQYLGGTMIVYDGKVEKHNIGAILTIDEAGDTIKSGGVYPAWHPTLPLIAYSSNRTGQTFYTYDPQKVEVQDTYSDLILYDIKSHKVMPLEKDTNDLDCFPAWSPDGKYLYYCSAHYEKHDSTPAVSKEMDLILNYEDVHYNLYRRAFDANNRSFGKRELVYDAAADTLSATLPRISPDGTKLMFTRGKYGVFHIWHNSSDLCMIDLQTPQPSRSIGALRVLDELNSPDVESYHSWSSSGKWVIFSSRRYDGNFTRPFMAHLNSDGTFTRPFELPMQTPAYHLEMLRSYNIPEFMNGPVTIKPHEFAKAIKGEE